MADHEHEDATTEGTGEPAPKAAKSELLAALSHLKNAAGILVGAADPAVRKAATEAERVLQKVGAEAEPLAKQLGDELNKMTKSVTSAIDGALKRKTDAPPADPESEVERLEREADKTKSS